MSIAAVQEPPMTLDGAAKALGCSRRWLQGWLSTHPEHGYRIGRSWRFTVLDIAAIRITLRYPNLSDADEDLKRALDLATPKRTSPRDPEYSCYAMRAGQLVKIGVAKDVYARRAAFQTGSSEPIEVLAVWPGDRFDEARAHEALKPHRVHGEWFNANDHVLNFLWHRQREAR